MFKAHEGQGHYETSLCFYVNDKDIRLDKPLQAWDLNLESPKHEICAEMGV